MSNENKLCSSKNTYYTVVNIEATVIKFLKDKELLPFAFAICQAVVAVAVGTIFFFDGVREERLVLFGVDFVPGMTAHTERIDLCPRIHYVRCCTVST